MSENQTRILEMLRDKKITVEEAERLLSLIGTEGNQGDTGSVTDKLKKRLPKYLRVTVEPGPGTGSSNHAERVNVRVPVSLIRAGMKFTSLIPEQAADEVEKAMKEHGINFDLRNIKDTDIDELVAALGELEVDVDGGDHKVRVYTE